MNKEKIVWQNERRKVEDLKPFPNNPRSASEKQEEDLGASIEKFDDFQMAGQKELIMVKDIGN